MPVFRTRGDRNPDDADADADTDVVADFARDPSDGGVVCDDDAGDWTFHFDVDDDEARDELSLCTGEKYQSASRGPGDDMSSLRPMVGELWPAERWRGEDAEAERE